MNRSVRWTVCCLGLLAILLTAGCQKTKKAKSDAQEEEGWNARAAYKPPPNATEPKRGGIRGDLDMAGSAGQNVRQGAERQKAKGIIKNISEFYHQYVAQNGRSPANQEEFVAFIQRDAPHVVNAIKDGYFVVTWKAQLSSNMVLAYEKASYAGARTVARGDGSIEVMKDADFDKMIQGGR